MKYTCPISITKPRATKKDKVYWLNINNYRNWHYIVNNEIKRLFCKHMELSLSSVDKMDRKPISVRYKLFWKDNRRVDLANVCCIVQKFFEDWLVYAGVIEDDNCEIIQEVIYEYCGIDRENPRCEVEIDYI